MQALLAQQGEDAALSPLFLYYYARIPHNRQRLVNVDLRDGLKAATREGICKHSFHDAPFTREGANTAPSNAAIAAAAETKIGFNVETGDSEYIKLPNPRNTELWKAFLLRGQALCFVFPITQGYVDLNNGATRHATVEGIVADPTFHVGTAIGYDDAQRAFRIRDSRGTAFGTGGDWFFPYEVVETPSFIQEVWTIQSIT
jgi:hypothetical protein